MNDHSIIFSTGTLKESSSELARIWNLLGYGNTKKISDETYLLFFRNTNSNFNHIHLQLGFGGYGVATHKFFDTKKNTKNYRVLMSNITRSIAEIYAYGHKDQLSADEITQKRDEHYVDIINTIWDRSGYIAYEPRSLINNNYQFFLDNNNNLFSDNNFIYYFLCIKSNFLLPHKTELRTSDSQLLMRTNSGTTDGKIRTCNEDEEIINSYRNYEKQYIHKIMEQYNFNYIKAQKYVKDELNSQILNDKIKYKDITIPEWHDLLLENLHSFTKQMLNNMNTSGGSKSKKIYKNTKKNKKNNYKKSFTKNKKQKLTKNKFRKYKNHKSKSNKSKSNKSKSNKF